MLTSAFSMGEAAYGSVSDLCEDFIRRSHATCALLVGQDGMLLHRCGAIADLDVDSLSALSAATFASGREMARLIGETTFEVAMQQGQQNHLEMIRVGDSALLVAVFDDHTTAAMVRLQGQRAAQQLLPLLGEGEAGAGPHPSESSQEERGPVPASSAFATQTHARAEDLRGALRMRTLSLFVALLAAAVALLGALLHR